jgi:hypothetical protein
VIERLKDEPEETRVLALTRAQSSTRLARAFAAPLGVWTMLRAASRGHALALVLWIWVPALIARVRKR